MAPAAALSMRDVTFAYSQREPVLRGVDLDVRGGEILVLLGPNGSGKSTLLRLAAGLARPQRGTITIAGGASAVAASREGRIGYIPQQLGLVRSATALDNAIMGGATQLSTMGSLFGLVPPRLRDRAEEALDVVGLAHKRDMPVKSLSGGERQRVAIARTLVQDAKLIIADELLSSLDVHQADAIVRLQRELRARGVAMLLSLHQIDLALAHADRVAFLRNGRLDAPLAPDAVSPEEARCALAP